MIFTRPRLLTWTGAAATAALTMSSLVATAALAGPTEAAPTPPAPITVPAPVLSPDFVPPATEGLAQVLRQPDGTTLKVSLSPARTGGMFEVGGYSVERDAAGVWRYVTGRDKSGAVQLSDVAAASGVKPAGIAKHAGRTPTGSTRPRPRCARASSVSSRSPRSRRRRPPRPRVSRASSRCRR